MNKVKEEPRPPAKPHPAGYSEFETLPPGTRIIYRQSRKHSWLEAAANIVVGFCLSMSVQVAIFPAFGIYVPIATNMKIVAVITGTSLMRAYLLRRLFNHWQGR